MLEKIRLMLMNMLVEQRKFVATSIGILCPNIQNKLEKLKAESASFIPHWNGKDKFEVVGLHGDQFVVNVTDRTCSCRLWHITGIPCKHAIATINHFGYNPDDYVHEAYSKDTFLRCYKYLLEPMHEKDDWPKTGNAPLLPPEVTRLLGRPKKSKRREPDEAPKGSKLKRK
ncbi:hypothetical protein MRB53_019721 [Persea americana]|uniref:Uncharacterized protein n=1 Tax=Persea americana TaxID=3435 RepID=A0ACC2L036_PERAE|nr:hypothetical protein MRB53_019721 [Persea americana]